MADALTAHGFAAHAEKHGDELRIVSEHCPFGDAAVEHPVICAVDRGMVKGMLGGLYGDTATEHRVVAAPWATTSASPPSPACPSPLAERCAVPRHYLDHASTSPTRPAAVEAMRRAGPRRRRRATPAASTPRA